MAFGFRECCNQFSYFTVTGIPASVSEFEVYYIRTLEGINFCATYVQIPTLNYQAPNYILLELSQQQNCDSCIQLYPCPTEDIILINQFTEGSVQIDTDCQVNTLQQMIVQCQSVNPTFSNSLDGTVSLLVVGGTPPYTFVAAGTQEVLGVVQDGDVYTAYQNVSAGTYSITAIDSTGDFSITRNCVLSGPPPIPVAVPIVTPASFFNAPDGSVNLDITGGIGPYTIIYEGEEIELPLTGLLAGTYYFQVIDSNNYLVEVEAVVTQPDLPEYPTNLCATFTKCGNEFKMSFELTSEFYNYRPVYNCTNPTVFGMTELKLRFETNYGGAQRWVTTNELVQIEDIQFTTPTGACDLGAATFRMFSTNSGPFILPQGSFKGLELINNITVVVTAGGCPPSVRVIDTTNACQNIPGQVIYEATGGAGPPYVYFLSSDGVSYSQTTATQIDVIAGTYSLKVRDSIGTESSVINFTISTGAELVDEGSITFNSNVVSANFFGTLDSGILDGQSRRFETVIEHFYDLSTIPDGLEFNGVFRMSIQHELIVGGSGHDTPLNSQRLRITFEDSWYDSGNGIVTGFMQNPNVELEYPLTDYNNSVYDSFNCGSWRLISLDEQNSGGLLIDFCANPSGGPSVIRSSPNKWKGCDNVETEGLSFIEGDTRGASFIGNWSYASNQSIPLKKNSKIYLRFKIILEGLTPAFIPAVLNETDDSTIQPQCYTPIGCAKLNVPNINNLVMKAYQSRLIMTTRLNVSVTQQPTGCFSIDTNWPGLNYGGPPNQNKLDFRFFTNLGVNESNLPFPTQTAALNAFRVNNTTGVPSWYTQLAP